MNISATSDTGSTATDDDDDYDDDEEEGFTRRNNIIHPFGYLLRYRTTKPAVEVVEDV